MDLLRLSAHRSSFSADMKKMTRRLPAILSMAALTALLSACGYRNVETPAGYVGYVTKGSLFGSAAFEKLQTGPTSSGMGFLYSVINVSVTPYTYDEEFRVDKQTGVLARDQLAISFDLHITFRIRPDRVREFLEKYSTLGPGDQPDAIVTVAYNNFVKQPARSNARAEVEKFDGLRIQENIGGITVSLRRTLEQSLRDTPFEIINVVVGNIQYPPNVTKAVADKIAALQELARQDTMLDIVKKQAEQRRQEAEGIADAMGMINAKLTPEYIQYEAIKAQLAMVNSPNHTTIYIPVGPMGVPLVSTVNSPSPEAPQPAPAQKSP
jgi:regulator of protease activity HflC (stomatin/prohibitin superfamily)